MAATLCDKAECVEADNENVARYAEGQATVFCPCGCHEAGHGSPDSVAGAVAGAVAAAKAAGLRTSPAKNDTLGPAIHAGHLNMGFVFVGDEVEIVYLNSLTGARSTRPGNPARIASAAALFIAGAVA